MPKSSSRTEKDTSRPQRVIHDWIAHPDEATLTPFQRLVRNVDWTGSPLGPMEQWPAQLRQMVLLVVADPTPAVVYWGDETTIVYNEAYTELIGSKHPALQGQDPRVEFAETWDYFENLLSTQRETAVAVVEGNQLLLLNRHGFLEEIYFSWKFVPIIGEAGYVVGSHATVVDVTREVISGRRLSTVRELSREIATTKTIEDLWSQIIHGLEHADKDIPLALLYSITGVSTCRPSSSAAAISNVLTGSLICTLEGSIGVPDGHDMAPSTFELAQNLCWLAKPFRKALKGSNPVLLQVEDGTLPSDVLGGIPWRGLGMPSSAIIVCPIHSTYSEDAVAFLVVALNPRQRFDEDYENFIQMLTKQITTPQISAILLREEVWKRQALAKQEAIDRAKLSQELTTLATEFEEIETKFARFAERAQVGLVISDAHGKILYANSLWRDLAQLDVGQGKVDWDKGIVPQDMEFVYLMFERIVQDGAPASFQFRLKAPWRSPGVDKDGSHAVTDTCVLCSSYPDLDQEGNVTTVMSCLTNISELKWIESQLRRRTADVEQRELMWRNFTDRAPIGLCLINSDGSLEFGNDTWWSMTETPRDEKSGLAWLQKSVLPEDVSKVEQMFQDALVHYTAATLEFQLNRFWEGPEPHDERGEAVKVRTTILGTVHTTFNNDGSIRHLVGWLTDISAQKAAEAVLRMRMDQAIDMKQQQERFIDMTSHELRNPLSAMLHCADEIINSLQNYRNVSKAKSNGANRDSSLSAKHTLGSEPPSDRLLDDAVEAADTIIYCAMHQKRIVDDILTLSRLDSNLLIISPEAEQPVQLVLNATKMFEAELKRAEMTLKIEEEESIRELNVKWTLLDPSRVLQIFINLMTNAIKFTRTEENRHITVAMGASLSKPSEREDVVEYIETSQSRPDHTLTGDWGDGEIIYLIISVTDTGRGLSEQERKVLFHLFQQASPKTHVRYGGSGLGLFICRQLVEMQGGQIGVASEAGKGSTFRFFVKTRRTNPPVALPSDSHIEEMARHESLGEACGLGPPNLQNDPFTPRTKRRKMNKDEPSGFSKFSTNFHVLVVEDNLVNQKVASKQLRNCGCTVSVANHGEEALEFLKRTEYWDSRHNGEKLSVVLMDLEMPIMDGITCVKRIRELEASGSIKGHVPVIAVTANARKDQITNAMNAGMDDVTTKPYRIQEMVKKIEEVMERYGRLDSNT